MLHQDTQPCSPILPMPMFPLVCCLGIHWGHCIGTAWAMPCAGDLLYEYHPNAISSTQPEVGAQKHISKLT